MLFERSGSVPKNNRKKLKMQRDVASKRRRADHREWNLGSSEGREEEEEVSNGMGRGRGSETEKWSSTDEQRLPQIPKKMLKVPNGDHCFSSHFRLCQWEYHSTVRFLDGAGWSSSGEAQGGSINRC